MPTVAKKLQLEETKVILKPFLVNGKEVYLLPMKHLAKVEFYSNCKLVIDSMQKNKFVVYAESLSTKEDIKVIDTIGLKKLRKTLSLDVTRNYSVSLAILKELVKRYNLVDQPSYENLGVVKSKIVDVFYLDF